MSNPYEKRDHDSKAEVFWHKGQVTGEVRAQQKRQKPVCVWLTGLSGSGKSTLANALESKLVETGFHTYLLDGDNVRHGLNKDLGMSDEDRAENIRRIGEVAKLMVDAGVITITAFISPFRADRDRVRALMPQDFVEVFVDAPLDVCEQRDPKGLYKKARAGQIKEFTGIDSPYEAPENPEIHVQTGDQSLEQCVEAVMEALLERIRTA